jgi:hypothetical protein
MEVVNEIFLLLTKKRAPTMGIADLGYLWQDPFEVISMDIIDEGKFKPVGKELEPDDRKRVALGVVMPADADGVRYRAFRNDLGQILLDPVKSVPYYEAWIYENPKRFASIQRGIKDIEAGRVIKLDLSEVDDS